MTDRKTLILVVDDNPQNLQYVGRLLADHGYEVGLAQSGLQALNFVLKDVPDLILLDIMMPEMDGFDVCRKLKSDLATRYIPIIFITARTHPQDVVRGFEAGGVDYVTKPFHSAELMARVQTHLEIRSLRGLLPICSSCKQIRDGDGYWKRVEEYLEQHSDIMFSHSICPECMELLYGKNDWFQKRQAGMHTGLPGNRNPPIQE